MASSLVGGISHFISPRPQNCGPSLRPEISLEEAARRVAQPLNSGEVAYVAARRFSECTPSERTSLVAHLIKEIRGLQECLYVDDTSILKELEPVETAISPEALKQNLRLQSKALYFSGHQLFLELQKMQTAGLASTPACGEAKRRRAEILHGFDIIAEKLKSLGDEEGIVLILEYLERILDPLHDDSVICFAFAEIEKYLSDGSKVAKSLEKGEEVISGQLAMHRTSLTYKAFCIVQFAELKAQANDIGGAIVTLAKAHELFLGIIRLVELVENVKLAVQRRDPVNPFTEGYQRVNKLAVVRYLCLAVEAELVKSSSISPFLQPHQIPTYIEHFLRLAQTISDEIMESGDKILAKHAIDVTQCRTELSFHHQLNFSVQNPAVYETMTFSQVMQDKDYIPQVKVDVLLKLAKVNFNKKKFPEGQEAFKEAARILETLIAERVNTQSRLLPSHQVVCQEVMGVCLAIGKIAVDAASQGSNQEVPILDCLHRFVESYGAINAELNMNVAALVNVQTVIDGKSSARDALVSIHEKYARLPEKMRCRVLIPSMIGLALKLEQRDFALELLAELDQDVIATADRLHVEGDGAALQADLDAAQKVLSVIQLHVRAEKVDTLRPLCAIVEGKLRSVHDLHERAAQAYREPRARGEHPQVPQGTVPVTPIRLPVTLSSPQACGVDNLFKSLATVYEQTGSEEGLRRLSCIDPNQKELMLAFLVKLHLKGKNDVALGRTIEEESDPIRKLQLYPMLAQIQAEKGMADDVSRSIEAAKQLLLDAMSCLDMRADRFESLMNLLTGLTLSSPNRFEKDPHRIIFGQALQTFIAAYLKTNAREAANALMQTITEGLQRRGGYKILDDNLLKIFVRVYLVLDQRDQIEKMIKATRDQKRDKVLETEVILALAEMHDLKGAEEWVNRMFAPPSETEGAASSQPDTRPVSQRVFDKAALLSKIVSRVFPLQCTMTS